jgi:membrane protease YdiL (CAAX protease family)
MESRKSPIPPALELLIVIGLTYGLLIYDQLRAFHPHTLQRVFTNANLLSLVIYELFTGGLALAVLRFNGRRFSDHDMALTATTVVDGLLLFVVNMLSDYVLYDLALFATGAGAAQPAPLPAFGLSLPVVLLVSLVNPFFEEGILLAYVVPALRKKGLQTALCVSLILRLATHLYQGPQAAISILPTGLLFFGYYWRTGKIWPPVLAHALLDFVPLMLLG